MKQPDLIEAVKTIERLRRTMPRNPDVLTVCLIAEAGLRTTTATTPTTPQDQAVKPDKPAATQSHNEFMRDYMRKWRQDKAYIKARQTP